jgi:hypothetical protein
MNKFRKIIPLCLLIIVITASCNNDDELTTIDSVNPPTAANLIFPANNTECNEGVIVSDTETDVMFKWDKATNAGSYVLTITNLNSGTVREIKTVSNEFLIRVLRSTPYSWVVKSKISSSNETVDSETWKFYNAGLPKTSHPPFPAEAISPRIGISVGQGTITLQWQATDIDKDIVSYKILMDNSSAPTTEVGNSNVNSLNVTVNSGAVYYWKVITTDAAGNASFSQVFQFKVN